MPERSLRFSIDGLTVTAREGQTLIEACDEAGIYIPRLCHHPELHPSGNCRVCTCRINGRAAAACVTPVTDGMVVESETPQLAADRRALVEMMFLEGNHACPGCVASGACELQATAYRLGMLAPTLPYQWPKQPIDASHPDIFLDRERCILCARCIRASRDVDGKSVFAFDGRGITMQLAVDGDNRLGETEMALVDKAARVCPTACIVVRREDLTVPNGQRRFDQTPIGGEIDARRARTGDEA